MQSYKETPANPYGVVILSRYPEYAQRLIASAKRFHKHLPPILVVRDRNEATYRDDAFVVDGQQPFVYARNANIGFLFFGKMDVVLCNDDLEIVEDDFFPRLHSISAKWPRCGLLSPLIDGGVGNPLQRYPFGVAPPPLKIPALFRIDTGTVCFPCVLIRRLLIDKIGPLDENFTGYGFDDDDYCIRTREAGFWTMITTQLRVKHGIGGAGLNRGYNWSCSFAREPERPSNQEYFTKKHTPKKTA